uniref:Mitochondrial carrier protein n=1 Tax=Chromera velia CCMP2878 TaxID=1169474 RepID=A0A0G4FH68_9ALVE|eukprot:Cvel_17006.t1-p1 / transcript=Cvel_17006.t1 / gene=Cvel_17006 / organism=Chromera_velia_CCMP2878 / gene_product=Protein MITOFERRINLIKE 1, chloroplastic, putative / transcript_product=Protein MITOFERRINLIKE 1, chloroplastic, putative / location=Cvel_scaffold1336:35653-37071(-) / protein_length=473 / sequence_SO=supercontig / SO=protein_coding / is_pseudo=false
MIFRILLHLPLCFLLAFLLSEARVLEKERTAQATKAPSTPQLGRLPRLARRVKPKIPKAFRRRRWRLQPRDIVPTAPERQQVDQEVHHGEEDLGVVMKKAPFWLKHVVAACAGRFVAQFATFPMDTMKTRLQANPTASFGEAFFMGAEGSGPARLLSAVQRIYRGSVPSIILGEMPYTMISFGLNGILKPLLVDKFVPPLGVGVCAFLAAFVGEIAADLWVVPSELIKQRRQSGKASTIADVLQQIRKEEGSLRGLYKGYAANVCRDATFRGLHLSFYEVFRSGYVRSRKRFRRTKEEEGGETEDLLASSQHLSPLESFSIGLAAGALAAALTTPLDVVKTRLMCNIKVPISAQKCTNGVMKVGTTLASMLKNEGLGAALRGVSARVGFIGPASAILFFVYEPVFYSFDPLMHQLQKRIMRESHALNAFIHHHTGRAQAFIHQQTSRRAEDAGLLQGGAPIDEEREHSVSGSS